MYCSNCGKELPDTAQFCTNCGERIQVNEKPVENMTPEVTNSVPMTEEVQAPVTEEKNQSSPDNGQKKTKKKKSKKGLVIALVIVFVVMIAAVAGVAFYMSPGQKYKRTMKKGDDFMSEQAYSDAVICYENALDIQKSREAEKALVKAYIKYAEKFVKQSNYTEAIDTFLEALDRDEDNDDALEGLLGAYIDFGNQKLSSKAYEEAEEQFENALALQKDNEEALAGKINCYVGFGDVAADSGDYDKALEYYDKILDWEEDNPSAYCGKAHVTALQGDLYRAMELLEEGLECNENNSKLLEEREYLIENVIVTARDMVWNDGSYSREEYNEEGNCIRSTSYNRRGILTYETTYDENGNTQWTKGYDERGNIEYETRFEYDSNGNLLKYIYNSIAYPENSNREEYEYDGNGNIIKQRSYSSSDQLLNITIYEYDENKQNTLYAYYYYSFRSLEDEKPYYSGWESNEYTYDNHGNVETRVYVSGYENDDGIQDESTYYESYEREYDGNGNVTSCIRSDGYGGTENTISTYDSQGNVLTSEYYYVNEYDEISYKYVTRNEYYADGTISWYWNGEYNGEDELIAETEISYNEAGNTTNYRYESYYDYEANYTYYTYEYDEHDNKISEIYDSSYDYTVNEYENSYDAFGNLTNVYEKKNGTSYGYRYEYQLKK